MEAVVSCCSETHTHTHTHTRTSTHLTHTCPLPSPRRLQRASERFSERELRQHAATLAAAVKAIDQAHKKVDNSDLVRLLLPLLLL